MSLNQPVGIPFQNTLSYVGPDMNIIPIKRFPREPTTEDKKYRIGQFAIIGRDPYTGTEGELWYLARFEANGDATWLQLDVGTPGVGIDALQTDDGPPAVGPNVSGIVGVLGGVGIVTSGQDPSTDVTISVDGSVVGQTITGDSGGALPPTAGNWNIVGGTGVSTAGAGSTLTINLDGSVVGQTITGNSGGALSPTAGNWNILGTATNGIQSDGAGSTLTVRFNSPYADGDFSFESQTGGTVRTLTVQNTVDAASSGAIIQAVVAGSASSANPIVKVSSVAQRAGGMSIDTASDIVILQRSISGSVVLSEEFMRCDGADGSPRAAFFGAGGVAVAGGGAGGTSFLHVSNGSDAVNSDAQLLLQSGDPTVGAGGGSQYIRWGSTNQTQFSMGQGKDASPGTQPLEIQSGVFVSGAGYLVAIPPSGNVDFASTGAILIPRGTTAQRPATPGNGMIRYNTTTAKFEGYEAGAWANLI